MAFHCRAGRRSRDSHSPRRDGHAVAIQGNLLRKHGGPHQLGGSLYSNAMAFSTPTMPQHRNPDFPSPGKVAVAGAASHSGFCTVGREVEFLSPLPASPPLFALESHVPPGVGEASQGAKSILRLVSASCIFWKPCSASSRGSWSVMSGATSTAPRSSSAIATW